MSIEAPVVAQLDVRPQRSTNRFPTPLLTAVTVGALVVTAVLTVRALLPSLSKDPLVTSYKLAQFWVTYDHGFVRRGLPGTILRALTGGHLTAAWATIAGALLAGVGVAALAGLAWQVSTNVQPGRARILAAALVVVSPFTVSLLVRDLGRYDALGTAAVLAVVLIAAASTTRRWVAVAGVALVAAAAAATLEFLVAPMAGVVVCALIRMGYRGRRLWLISAVTILPAAVIAAASVVAAPRRSTLLAWVDEAAAANTGVGRSTSSAISALNQPPAGLLRSLTLIPPSVQLMYLVGMGGCFVLAAFVLWQIAGAPRPRLFWGFAIYYAASAVALSTVGIDYRRWWAFMFVAMLGSLALIGPGRRPAADGRWFRWVVVFAIAGSVALQVVPYYPRWIPAAQDSFTLSSSS